MCWVLFLWLCCLSVVLFLVGWLCVLVLLSIGVFFVLFVGGLFCFVVVGIRLLGVCGFHIV